MERPRLRGHSPLTKKRRRSLRSPYYTKRMSKTINFIIKERLSAVGLLNAGKFNNLTLASVLADIPNIVVSEEEWVDAKRVKTPTDEEVKTITDANPEAKIPQNWTWDPEMNKDIELQAQTVDALLFMIKEKSDANELTLADSALLSLQAKLEAQ